MTYTSQHCCDKTMDDKMALYLEFCFPNCKKSWWIKLHSFVLGGDCLNRPLLDPPLTRMMFSKILTSSSTMSCFYLFFIQRKVLFVLCRPLPAACGKVQRNTWPWSRKELVTGNSALVAPSFSKNFIMFRYKNFSVQNCKEMINYSIRSLHPVFKLQHNFQCFVGYHAAYLVFVIINAA